MLTAVKYPVPDRVKPSFVIFDIRALWLSGANVWHRMLFSCTHMTTVGVKGLPLLSMAEHMSFTCYNSFFLELWSFLFFGPFFAWQRYAMPEPVRLTLNIVEQQLNGQDHQFRSRSLSTVKLPGIISTRFSNDMEFRRFFYDSGTSCVMKLIRTTIMLRRWCCFSTMFGCVCVGLFHCQMSTR